MWPWKTCALRARCDPIRRCISSSRENTFGTWTRLFGKFRPRMATSVEPAVFGMWMKTMGGSRLLMVPP
jgi:hypothetical protein